MKSAMLLGQARGAAVLAAAETGLEVQEYSPLEVKQAVVGYGRAAKEQIQAMVRSILRIPQELNADAADALAVALCLAHSLPWQNSLQRGPLREAWREPPVDPAEGRRISEILHDRPNPRTLDSKGSRLGHRGGQRNRVPAFCLADHFL